MMLLLAYKSKRGIKDVFTFLFQPEPGQLTDGDPFKQKWETQEKHIFKMY